MIEARGSTRWGTIAASAVAMTCMQSCAATAPRTPVQEVVTQRERYLHDHMGPLTLPDHVRGKVATEGAARIPFARLVISVESSSEEDGRSRKQRAVQVFVNVGGGLVERQEEWTANDLPYRINSALAFGGFLDLRWQVAYLNREAAEPPVEVTNVQGFSTDALHPLAGKDYRFELAYRSEQRSFKGTTACRAGAPTPAAAIHGSLAGAAIELDCESVDGKGVTTNRTRYVLLEDYGVAVRIGSITPRSTETRKIVDVKISG